MIITCGTIGYISNGKKHQATFTPGTKSKHADVQITCTIAPLETGSRISVEITPTSQIEMNSLSLTAEVDLIPDSRIYCNGYQSWTDSREFSLNEKIKKLLPIGRLFKLHRYGDAHFISYSGKKGGFHSHTYTYIKQKQSEYTLIGSLDEQNGYTLFHYNAPDTLIISKECDGMSIDRPTRALDIIIINGNERFVIDAYFDHFKNSLPLKEQTGWTSWYNYYTNITEEIILENVEAYSAHRIPIDIFQIDDGYQTAVGDWLSIKPSFPRGMGHIADSIHSRGYKAGLWLAPFICEKTSELFRTRPDWLVREKGGAPAVAGWNPGWSGTFYSLDIYHPEVRDYLKKVFRTVFDEWHFDMVKLDFLYGAALIPRMGKSRGQIMAEGMKFLRELAGNRLILGCGVPLGPSFGTVDFCRIGGDIALRWEDPILSRMRYRERVSTRSSLMNTISRRHMNRKVFINDPDVIILRKENNNLTLPQRHTLFMINNLFGGLVFTSDNISRYDNFEMRIYRSMFPLKEKTIHDVEFNGGVYKTRFTIGECSYIAVSNFNNTPASVSLAPHAFTRVAYQDFTCHFEKGGVDITLDPYESRCYLTIPDKPYSIAGSTAHIFPGSEVDSVDGDGKNITVSMNKKYCGTGTLFIRVPGAGDYKVQGKTTKAYEAFPGIFVTEIVI